MKKYLRVWMRLAVMGFLSQYVVSRTNSFFLISGKLGRFFFFFFFLISLLGKTKTLGGYSLDATLMFFLTFNIIDIVAQFFLRGTYWIRGIINSGKFDSFLTRPISTLFLVVSQTVDLLDFLTFIPVLLLTVIVILRLGSVVTLLNLGIYSILVIFGLIIAASIHIIVAALAVWTQELENEIWIYRDLMTMGRFPVDIFAKPIQLVITFLVPIAVMVSYPTKALLGILSWQSLAVAGLMTGVFLIGSLSFWKMAVTKYSSVSS